MDEKSKLCFFRTMGPCDSIFNPYCLPLERFLDLLPKLGLTLSSIYTHFNTPTKTVFGKRGKKVKLLKMLIDNKKF